VIGGLGGNKIVSLSIAVAGLDVELLLLSNIGIYFLAIVASSHTWSYFLVFPLVVALLSETYDLCHAATNS
jgi:hypothetical protein